jgi:hypothetical protein
MKLTSTQIDRVLDQFRAEVIPSDSPALPELEEVFGMHTFFLAREGLHLVERSPSTNSVKHPAFIVRVASWWNEESSLMPSDPEVVVAVDLSDAESAEPDA